MRDGSLSVVLYSDQPVLSKGLTSAFEAAPEFRLTQVLNSLTATAGYVEQHGADILLLDFTADLTLSVLQQLKHSGARCKVVLWAYSITNELAFQAMEQGVRGILRKTMPIETFMAALHAISEGELWFDREILESFFCGNRVVLTRREGQLISLLSQGLKNKEIAATLQITEGTVKVYLSRLFRKLGVNDRFELALFGLKSLQVCLQNDPYNPATLQRAESDLLALHSILISGPEGRHLPAGPRQAFRAGPVPILPVRH